MMITRLSNVVKQDGDLSDTDGEEMSPDVSSAELLDEMTTHRGEVKRRSMSFNERPSFHVSLSQNYNQHACMHHS